MEETRQVIQNRCNMKGAGSRRPPHHSQLRAHEAAAHRWQDQARLLRSVCDGLTVALTKAIG
eukprot:3346000-Pleurochrysis_carterae.AAC.3